jgi:calcineurin-like phosphoesterase family protein
MSGRTWVYSDPHFYHKNICRFESSPGVKLRPWDDVEQMTEDMIKWYNEMVDDGDRVYILGDVTFSPSKFKDVMLRLKGRKVLVPGNHEPRRFDKICTDTGVEVRGYVVKKGFIMSHIPIHEGSLSRWKLNIHGHTHANNVKDMFAGHQLQTDDQRYFCACVEQTNFRPILLDDILKQRNIV